MEQWILMMKKNDFYGLAKQFHISPYLVRILCNRGIDTQEKIEAFLHGTPKDMYDPFLLKDMEKACRLLLEDVKQKKAIRIIGDYDVDGVTSAYILKKMFQTLGVETSVVIPHRVEDGYGLNLKLVRDAIEDGVQTIVTCDNGISAYDEIVFAKQNSLCVVVTDHHEVPYEEKEDGTREEVVPPADAVINPKQAGCQYPYSGVCGALVAYKLASAMFLLALQEDVLEESVARDVLEELLELAALGTICDVMELFDENRIVVKYGLRSMRASKNAGLRSLIKQCGIEGEITNYHVGFVIGPCLNAMGRLDTAQKAVELFEQQDELAAAELAKQLKEMNDVRKEMTQQYVDQAVNLIEEQGVLDRVLVIYLPECHESLAGIIAGRIRELYYRPVFVVTKGKEELKGSGRSIEGYHMRDGLWQVSSLLLKFGGHQLAAGFSLLENNLEAFRKQLNMNCALTDEQLKRKVYIDIDLPIQYADMEFVSQLSNLEPFGTGNRYPLFAQRGVKLSQFRVLGKERRVARFLIQGQDGARAAGIYFGQADDFVRDIEEGGGMADLIYSPKINEFRGERSLQLEVKHYRIG